jgi:hypothetical protein
MPKRPDNGLLAWQATIGYIATEYSPDAMLTLRATPSGNGVTWQGTASWGDVLESLENQPSVPIALRDLWLLIYRNHTIFKTMEAAAKGPMNYRDDQWLDEETQTTVDRMVEVTKAAFHDDWMFIVVYQPVAVPSGRVQARLLAKNNSVHISGRGASVREACRDLYHNAAPGYFAGRAADDILA